MRTVEAGCEAAGGGGDNAALLPFAPYRTLEFAELSEESSLEDALVDFVAPFWAYFLARLCIC